MSRYHKRDVALGLASSKFCRFCGKEFNGRGLGGHVSHCQLNPNKVDMSKAKRSPLTAEHKIAVGKGQKSFLDANPDKVPYRVYHSSKMSYPEQFFQDALIRNGITGWIYNFGHKRFSYDFAFPELKIDIEIDGSTHKLPKIIESDRIRDEFSISQGWKVYRIEAKLLYGDASNADKVVQELKRFIWG